MKLSGSEQLDGFFDDNVSSFRCNSVDSGLNFVTAAGETFLHGNIAGNILRKFHNKGVFAGALCTDRAGDSVEAFSGKCGEHEIFADLNVGHTAAV